MRRGDRRIRVGTGSGKPGGTAARGSPSSMVNEVDDVHLTAEQQLEVERRLRDPSPSITHKEVRTYFRRLRERPAGGN